MTTTEDESPLARFCRQRGWTRQQVGHLVGAHPSLVGRWWRREVVPGPAYALRLIWLSNGELALGDLLTEEQAVEDLVWHTWIREEEGR